MTSFERDPSIAPAPPRRLTIASVCVGQAVQELCTNGVPGIENGMGTVCCPSLCGGICGGTGCEAADVENCCAGAIVDSGVYCDDSETAPCIIGKWLCPGRLCVHNKSYS